MKKAHEQLSIKNVQTQKHWKYHTEKAKTVAKLDERLQNVNKNCYGSLLLDGCLVGWLVIGKKCGKMWKRTAVMCIVLQNKDDLTTGTYCAPALVSSIDIIIFIVLLLPIGKQYY